MVVSEKTVIAVLGVEILLCSETSHKWYQYIFKQINIILAQNMHKNILLSSLARGAFFDVLKKM